MEPNRQSWNCHARRFLKINPLPLDVVDYYGTHFPTEADINLIGDPKDLKVLELGSGSCNCGIALAAQGAEVTCLDLSDEQLVIGKELAASQGVTIKTIHGDMAFLERIETSNFDLVLSINALMYAEYLDKVFNEVHRVLKPEGRFIFSVDHPIMMAIGATDLWPEEKSDPWYGYSGQIRWKWNKEDDYWFISYRRPVSEYVNLLVNNNLYIQGIHELYPKTIDPGWVPLESELRQRYPSALAISARKCTFFESKRNGRK